MHELGHVLGLYHEHQRPDRNNYIQINWGNIQSGTGSQFQPVSPTITIGSYDFASTMHYSAYAFSKNGLPTIEVKPAYSDYAPRIGIRALSEGDATGMESQYPCVSGCTVPPFLSGDDFDAPLAISNVPFVNNVASTFEATTAWDDPLPSCGNFGAIYMTDTLWYEYTPSTTQRLQLDTEGSGYDTVIAIYTGTRGNLTEIACNDDTDDDFGSFGIS